MSFFMRNLHPVTRQWVFNIGINGGSIDRATINLVDRLVTRPLANSGLLSQMIRLNVCVGSLKASFVPLVNNNGGAVIDINNGFVESDYAQKSGWTTNGTKYLDTTYIPSTTLGMGIYIRQYVAASYAQLMGAANTANTVNYKFGTIAFATNNPTVMLGGVTEINSTTFTMTGLLSTSRVSTTLLTLYSRGVNKATNTTSTAISTTNTSIYVFKNNSTANLPVGNGTNFSGYHIDSGLNDSDSLKFAQIIQTFNAALNRQV